MFLMRTLAVFMIVGFLPAFCQDPFEIELETCNQSSTSPLYPPLLVDVSELPLVACVPTNLTQSFDGTTFTLEPNELFLVNITGLDNEERTPTVSLVYSSKTGTRISSLESSCVQQPVDTGQGDWRLIEIHTQGEPFFNLVNMQFSIKVDDKIFPVQFYTPGLHLPSSPEFSAQINFNLSDIQNVVILSVLVLRDARPLPPATSYLACERNTTSNLFTSVGFVVDKRQTDEMACVTFESPLRRKSLFVELKLMPIGTLEMRCYELVIITTATGTPTEEQCQNFSEDPTNRVVSPALTICNLVDDSPTTSPSSVTTTDPTTDGGGLTAEAIAGVVSGILIGAVVATVMIILAVIFLWRWRNSKRIIGEIRAVNGNVEYAAGIAGRNGDAVMDIPQQTIQEETDNAKRVHMLFAPSALKSDIFGDSLADEERVSLGGLPDIPQNGRGYDLQLIALLRKPWCQRLYIVYQDSPEWLKANDPTVWKCISILQSRPLSNDILSKVVLVRVYDKRNGDTIQDIIEGPILTVNICRHRWDSNPKECAKLIHSKVRLNQRMLDKRRGISHSATPPDTGSPTTTHTVATLTGAPPTRTPPPPQYTPQPPAESNDLLREVLPVLNRIAEGVSQTAQNTARTANNTENLPENIEVIRETATATLNQELERDIDREAPDNN